MINDGLEFARNVVLCYTHPVRTGEQTWYRLLSHPISLGRALHNNDGHGAAFMYVLEQVDRDTHETIMYAEHWHVQSEFLRAHCKSWQYWEPTTNVLQALKPTN